MDYCAFCIDTILPQLNCGRVFSIRKRFQIFKGATLIAENDKCACGVMFRWLCVTGPKNSGVDLITRGHCWLIVDAEVRMGHQRHERSLPGSEQG